MFEGLQGQTVTLALIGVNVAASLHAFSKFREGHAPDEFLFEPFEVREGRNLRGMLWSHVCHADTAHLLFNMFTLYFFGPVVEELGALALLTIYVFAGVGATLATYVVHRDDPDYRALGASGSVTGVLFSAIVLQPDMSIGILPLPVPIPAPLFAIGYVLLSIWASRRRLGNIGHEAHIGGALTGFLLTGARVGFGPLLERLQRLLGS